MVRAVIPYYPEVHNVWLAQRVGAAVTWPSAGPDWQSVDQFARDLKHEPEPIMRTHFSVHANEPTLEVARTMQRGCIISPVAKEMNPPPDLTRLDEAFAEYEASPDEAHLRHYAARVADRLLAALAMMHASFRIRHTGAGELAHHRRVHQAAAVSPFSLGTFHEGEEILNRIRVPLSHPFVRMFYATVPPPPLFPTKLWQRAFDLLELLSIEKHRIRYVPLQIRLQLLGGYLCWDFGFRNAYKGMQRFEEGDVQGAIQAFLDANNELARKTKFPTTIDDEGILSLLYQYFIARLHGELPPVDYNEEARNSEITYFESAGAVRDARQKRVRMVRQHLRLIFDYSDTAQDVIDACSKAAMLLHGIDPEGEREAIRKRAEAYLLITLAGNTSVDEVRRAYEAAIEDLLTLGERSRAGSLSYYLGVLERKVGRKEEAARAYQKAMELTSPITQDAYFFAVEELFNLRQDIDLLNAALRASDGSTNEDVLHHRLDLLKLKATSLEQDPLAAAAALTEGAREAREGGYVFVQRALRFFDRARAIYLATGEYSLAMQRFEEALDLILRERKITRAQRRAVARIREYLSESDNWLGALNIPV